MHLQRLSKFMMVTFALSGIVAQAKNSTSAPQFPDVSAISQIEVTLITGDLRTPRPMLEEDLSKWG